MSDETIKTTPCSACAGTGEGPSYGDDGEPVRFKSGKREGEIKIGKCPACSGDGEVEA